MLLSFRQFVGAYAKAITAVLTSAVTWAVLHYGLKVDPTTVAAVSTLVVGAAVWRVPNVPPPEL